MDFSFKRAAGGGSAALKCNRTRLRGDVRGKIADR